LATQKDKQREESIKENHEIIQKILNGEKDAFSQIVNKYQNALYGIVFKMINNRDEVDDIVQETFIKAFSSIKSFDERYSFATWLFKIGTNNCIDHLRKRKINSVSINSTISNEDGENDFKLPDLTYEADRNIIEEQRKKLIEDAINSLPEKYAVVIRMRHQEDKTYEQISKELNMPVGTVKAHIFRAREMLNKYLKDKKAFY
jgi:RNA polymerase sigma-70 factor (ECF subfamily)